MKSSSLPACQAAACRSSRFVISPPAVARPPAVVQPVHAHARIARHRHPSVFVARIVTPRFSSAAEFRAGTELIMPITVNNERLYNLDQDRPQTAFCLYRVEPRHQ